MRSVRDELKLNLADVGWYQIRNALKARNASGDFPPVDFGTFEAAYKALGDKLAIAEEEEVVVVEVVAWVEPAKFKPVPTINISNCSG